MSRKLFEASFSSGSKRFRAYFFCFGHSFEPRCSTKRKKLAVSNVLFARKICLLFRWTLAIFQTKPFHRMENVHCNNISGEVSSLDFILKKIHLPFEKDIYADTKSSSFQLEFSQRKGKSEKQKDQQNFDKASLQKWLPFIYNKTYIGLISLSIPLFKQIKTKTVHSGVCMSTVRRPAHQAVWSAKQTSCQAS